MNPSSDTLSHFSGSVTAQSLSQVLNNIRPAIDEATRAASGNVSLWGGLAGYAVYYAALTRLYPDAEIEQQALQLLTDALEQLAPLATGQIARNAWMLWAARDLSEHDATCQWWPSSHLTGSPLLIAQYPQGYRDLGMAHGNPGVIGLLGQCGTACIPNWRSRCWKNR